MTWCLPFRRQSSTVTWRHLSMTTTTFRPIFAISCFHWSAGRSFSQFHLTSRAIPVLTIPIKNLCQQKLERYSTNVDHNRLTMAAALNRCIFMIYRQAQSPAISQFISVPPWNAFCSSIEPSKYFAEFWYRPTAFCNHQYKTASAACPKKFLKLFVQISWSIKFKIHRATKCLTSLISWKTSIG